MLLLLSAAVTLMGAAYLYSGHRQLMGGDPMVAKRARSLRSAGFVILPVGLLMLVVELLSRGR